VNEAVKTMAWTQS